MCEKKNTNQKPINERFLEHGEISERNSHFSMEPAGELDYDILLMTGNQLEGKDEE